MGISCGIVGCSVSSGNAHDQVWSFIVEREVEAPERFQAIQSYRASMAVLRQQRLFVRQLFDSGVVKDAEHDELLRCAAALVPPKLALVLLHMHCTQPQPPLVVVPLGPNSLFYHMALLNPSLLSSLKDTALTWE